MSTADPLNVEIKALCRACLITIENPAFTLIKNSELIDKYIVCTSLKVDFADGLSLNICENCNKSLNDFYDFRKMCQQSVEKLLSHTNTAPTVESSEQNVNILEVNIKECKVEIEDLNTETDADNPNILELPENSDEEDLESSHDNNSNSSHDDHARSTSESESNSSNFEPNHTDKKMIFEKKKRKTSDSTHKSTIFTCKVCDKKFYKKFLYDGHVRQHEGLKPFVCEVCNNELSTIRSFRRHMKDSHGDDRKLIPCKIPGCDKSYKSRTGLQWHVDKVHRKLKVAPLICELCGKVLKSPNTLRCHMNAHADIKPFACNQCPKRFATQCARNDHIMRHEGVKRFSCHICGLKKTTRNELRTHIKYHTQQKIYKCEFCSSAFSRTVNLNRHIDLVHKKIKKFQCTYCDLAFGKAETLKHHMMRHTGEKPEECNICGKRFIQVVALRRHLKIHEKTQNK